MNKSFITSAVTYSLAFYYLFGSACSSIHHILPHMLASAKNRGLFQYTFVCIFSVL